MLALLIVLLILGAGGVYYYLNRMNKISPQNTTALTPTEKPLSPTPTTTMEEDLNSIQIATDDADLKDLNADLLGL